MKKTLLKYKLYILGILIPIIIIVIYFVPPLLNSDELAKIRKAGTGTGWIAFASEEMSAGGFKCQGLDDAYFSHSLIRKTESPNGVADIIEYIDYLSENGCSLSVQALNVLIEKDIETGDNNDTTAGYKELLQLVAKGKFPERCYYPLTYNIGKISDKFLAEGFTRDSLLDIIKSAEKEWETALGKNLFEYNPDESMNSINFTADDSDHPEDVSGTNTYLFPSNATKLFETNIHEKLFDTTDSLKDPVAMEEFKKEYTLKTGYDYSSVSREMIIRYYVRNNILYQFSHALGFNNFVNDSNAFLDESSPLFNTPAKLTEAYISALKNWCGVNTP